MIFAIYFVKEEENFKKYNLVRPKSVRSAGLCLIPSTFSAFRSRARERYVLRISDVIAFF